MDIRLCPDPPDNQREKKGFGSEIDKVPLDYGAQLMSNVCYLICLWYLIRSRAVTIGHFFPRRQVFLHICATCSELQSIISTKGETEVDIRL